MGMDLSNRHEALDDGAKPLFDVSDQTRALLEQPDAPEPLFDVAP